MILFWVAGKSWGKTEFWVFARACIGTTRLSNETVSMQNFEKALFISSPFHLHRTTLGDLPKQLQFLTAVTVFLNS